MADQIEIHLPNTIVNEETTFTVTAYFRTRASKAASTPTTIHYKIDDLQSRQTITDWTAVSTPAGNNDIVITSTENEIIDGAHLYEKKQILIKIDSGLSTQVIAAKTWRVNNLEGIE